MATRETIKKIEALESRNCDIFGKLIWQARMKGNQAEADEFRHKLRGYLTALVDVGTLTQRELQEAYLWYATVKNYGTEEVQICRCAICEGDFPRDEMIFTKDCHGIPFRLVCLPCYERAMEKGYDGEYYTEADECLDADY